MVPLLAGFPAGILFLCPTARCRRERILLARYHDLLHIESHVERDGFETLLVPIFDVADARNDREPLGHEQSIGGVQFGDCGRVRFDESIAVGLQEVVDLGL